jgi:uncharacterized protein with GYD domain
MGDSAMAKKSKSGGAKKGTIDDGEVTYFYLINLTAKGRIEKKVVIRKEQEMVTKLVENLGGKCELYSVHGPHDFISRVTQITPAGALKIAKAIEAGGTVMATYTSGFHIFK